MLAQETADGIDITFSEEELLRDNTQIFSTTVKETTTAVHRVACKEIKEDMSLSATASLVCEITKGDLTYFDVSADKDNKTEAAVCEITEPISADVEVRRPVCKISETTFKTVDLANLYFSDEKNPCFKVNVMKTMKDSEVFPCTSRRRHHLARYITSTAIKAGSTREKCDRCEHATTKKRMHLHYRQHLTKHFCNCGYSSTIYDFIYQHSCYGHCREPSQTIYKVDRLSYPRFLRHVKWQSAQPFGERRPTLDEESRRTLTYKTSAKQKPSIQQR